MKSWRRVVLGALLVGGCGGVVTEVGASGSTGGTTSAGTSGTGAGAGGASASAGGAGGHGGAGGAVLVGAGSAAGGFDAGVPVVDAGVAPAAGAEACLARPEGCPFSEDPPPKLAEMHLQTVLSECGSANGCPNGCFCGELTVSFDAAGCALSLGYDSGLLPEVEACLVDHLNAERWSCGAGRVADLLVPCTTRK